ncbi:MAG: cobalt transporter [Pseudobdellovibrio sp.]|jgi:Co/Zn/Cd efflux system component|nr:cobalt transporter [Pseudobdellovibrio sp.]
MNQQTTVDHQEFRSAVKFVAIANFLYFFIELYYAVIADSVSLFADSIDFLEDTSINILILVGLSWSARKRSYLGLALAIALVIPGILTVLTALHKLQSPLVPNPDVLSVVGLGALLVNGVCALRLAKFKHAHGSLFKAAFLSARNDVYANVAIVAAGISTAYLASYWPDLIVGIGIAILNASAAKEILKAAKRERVQEDPKV